jgi:hypothetical protein
MTNFIVDNILNIFKKEENKQEIKNLFRFLCELLFAEIYPYILLFVVLIISLIFLNIANIIIMLRNYQVSNNV